MAANAPTSTPASEKINVGVIGVNGQGSWNMRELLKLDDVAVTAICEVYKDRREAAITRCKASGKTEPKGYVDYREVLARDDIDAVLIATPPHWHALMMIDACKAGKDFYCEKPMTMHVGESVAVTRAVKKHKRITQIGTQIHARDNYRRVVEYVRSGNLGDINHIRTFNIMNQGPEGVGNDPDCDPPAGLDWDRWIGPAPDRKFNPILFKSSYYHPSFMDYSGGWTLGMGPHIVDLPVWALDIGLPIKVSASGGRYIIKDAGDGPDLHAAVIEYPDRVMNWHGSLTNSYGFDFQGKGGMARRLGIYFHGVNGTLAANYGTMKIIEEGKRMKDMKPPEQSIPKSKGHHREWIDGIKTRTQPLCNVFYHHRVNTALTMANLSLKLGRSINFDPKTERIVGDDEAAKMAVPTYREPYKFPVEYV